ncbi:MAG: GNAT family N-acetyltransferase [Lachnospiraceae bacterium]|nr:GNAT family N-acetyltransferase [Lachnospiraceae bacterium]
MEYRMATKNDAEKIYEIVKETIKKIYPRYYLPQIVDAFLEYHNQDRINKDIEAKDSYVLVDEGKVIGTGTKNDNHIVRVYVLPEFQGKGYGTYIMNQLEKEIGKEYKVAELDASASACNLYYKLGYKTIDHGVWDCAKGVTQIYEIMEKELSGKLAGNDGMKNKLAKENGKKIAQNELRLRPYKPSDANTITSWIHSEKDQRNWSADRYENYPVTPKDINDKYFGSNGACDADDDFFPVTAMVGNEIVGHMILRYPNEDRDTIRFGFVIVDDKIRGKGYGKRMMKLAIQYAFDILKAKKVTLGVFENNMPAYYCYKAAGFEENNETLYFDCMGEQWKCIEMEVNK